LDLLKIPFKWERFTAFDGTTINAESKKIQGVMGCLRSHQMLLKHIQELKLELAIIFEDDAELCENFEIKFNDILKKLPDDWDLFYLGGWNVGEIKKYADGLNIAEKVYTTHAYVIRNKFIDTVLERLYSRDYKADVLLAESLPMGKCFICSPVLAWQKEGYSDIVCRKTNNIHLR
jgi:GR25 family glycosyltransferase involved in LPS biosynthesis